MSGNISSKTVQVNGTQLNVATSGKGPVIVLLHGWPHTWRVWQSVLPMLAQRCTVIAAPDLRGLGGSGGSGDGGDAQVGADDIAALLDVLGAPSADVVAIDAGVPIAALLALTRSERVRRLVVMEGLLPGVAGGFPAAPWWFGFHAVPGLAETVLAGHEAEYLDYFLTAHSVQPIPHDVRDAFVEAYTGRDALRRGFEYYRAYDASAARFAEVLAERRLTVPTLAIAGGVVGGALARQLRPFTDDLATAAIADCGHLVPLEQPDALVRELNQFLSDGPPSDGRYQGGSGSSSPAS